MRQAFRILCLASLALASGCTMVSARIESPMSATGDATVFVANGAGNYQMLSKSLRLVTKLHSIPLEIVTHDWSHGKHRVFADHLCYQHAREEGKKLADSVMAYRVHNPNRSIHLIGHSAGATVVVSALEHLPPRTVERAVLLAPSLSADYELQPALSAVQDKMHVFYSKHDYVLLGICTRILGTPDRSWSGSSGRIGFCANPPPEKLVQRAWEPGDYLHGNNGGHFGSYAPGFLRHHIVPLLR